MILFYIASDVCVRGEKWGREARGYSSDECGYKFLVSKLIMKFRILMSGKRLLCALVCMPEPLLS